MKRIAVFFAMAAAVLTAFPSCVRELPESPSGAQQNIQFTAGVPETRTAFTTPEGDLYPVLWTENDSRVKVSLNAIAVTTAAVTPAPDGKSATFSASFDSGYTAPYSFFLFSPASAYDRLSGGQWQFKVPDKQTPTALSVDECAQILMAEVRDFDEMPRSVNFSLKHWTAYGLLSFENLDLGSATVTGVELTAELPWAGFWVYVIDEGISRAIEGVNTIKIQTSSVTDVWFACAPVDLSGTKLTVKVLTDGGDFTKEIMLPEGRNLTSGKVARMKVDMAGIKPRLKVQRVWGKYSTADASWNEYFGGTPNSDRNVAMDDEYIYIAETNKTGNLWAISITDPSVVKKLPVGTVTGVGTFSLSCPRIIKNTDASVNDGKDVLVVSNMIEGDPTLYVYDKGTEADPSAYSMQTWASRRLGDTFTAWGSLQSGMLFFKDFGSVQGTVTFKLSGKFSGLWLYGRIAAPAQTGAGAYFPFPDNISAGLCSVRGGTTSWVCKSSRDVFNMEGADNSPNLTALSGYFADAAFRFFEFAGKRYIAYTRQVSTTDGRLFILEGGAGQPWEEILSERSAHPDNVIIYRAAIQENAETQDDYNESPKASGNSGMDLDVRVTGDAVYIAVVKQNVGLSLFKMSME